jgi:4,5-dihydroxyphthalate decarboxylase
MAEVPLSFACGLYDRVNALYTGEVKAKGIDLDFVVVNHPRILFDNQSKAEGPAYDSSELSASEYITRYAPGDRTWVAIPVFPSRLFRHGFIVVNTNKIKTPRDLNGAKCGVQLYTMTAAVWIRGLLEEELGVNTNSIEWIAAGLQSTPLNPLAEAVEWMDLNPRYSSV